MVGRCKAEKLGQHRPVEAVVSFGTFGIIAAIAVETAPIYLLDFPPIADIHHADLKAKLSGFADAPPEDLWGAQIRSRCKSPRT